jgi:glycerophosphoryl diester phosphodiesterase
VFLGPALAESWDEASAADITKLDIKQTSHRFLNDLVAFLNQRSPSRHVMIASRDRDALLYLHRRLHRVTLLFTMAFPDAVHRLESDRALENAVSGVSVFHGLVDPALVAWVHEHKMQILAWTVNGNPEFNHLVRLGVDGITTDNLAILKALGP